jgi:stage V sporulation protein D (sporulation-specific penicillin-binding protein)
MNYIERLSKQYKEVRVGTDWRLSALLIFFLIFTGVLITRLFLLQVIHHSDYIARASSQYLSYREYDPLRGNVYIQANAEGGLIPIAENRLLWEIYAVPYEIQNPSSAAGKLAPLLDLDIDDELLLKSRLAKGNDPYEPIDTKISDEIKESIDTLGIKGIYAREETYRYYPEHEMTSHLTGFLGYRDDELVGSYGIESYFQDVLKGDRGFIEYAKAASGEEINVVKAETQESQDGSSVVLTIDSVVQFKVCGLLDEAIGWSGALGGTVIVMESATGKIRAMCSAPSFNSNEYYNVEDINIYNNPALFTAYEPGSVFKSFTMAAALNEGAVKPDDTYIDEGELKIDGYPIRNSDEKAYGEVNMTTILTRSLNLGAIEVANRVGRKSFKEYITAFGFGINTGVELSGEQPGNIKALDERSAVSLATASFGHGITATPIQLTSAYNAIARRGSYIQPSIIEKVIHPDGFEQQIKNPETRQILNPKSASLLTSMLVTVIEEGHAKSSSIEGYVLAGKTGTAQIAKESSSGYEENAFNHTFVGYGPVDNPFFTMLVKLERPTSYEFSSGTAAPLFGQIAKFVLQYYNIAPSY